MRPGKIMTVCDEWVAPSTSCTMGTSGRRWVGEKYKVKTDPNQTELKFWLSRARYPNKITATLSRAAKQTRRHQLGLTVLHCSSSTPAATGPSINAAYISSVTSWSPQCSSTLMTCHTQHPALHRVHRFQTEGTNVKSVPLSPSRQVSTLMTADGYSGG